MSRAITASMLYDFTQCPHRVELDLNRDPNKRNAVHPFVELLWQRGHAYEKTVIERLNVPFLNLRTVANPDERERRTLAAMASGESLIYGGRIRSGDLLGEPDVLRRSGSGYVPGDIKSGAGVEGGSEDADGKPKKHYAVQLALYVDVLSRLGVLGVEHPFIWDIRGEEIPYDLQTTRGPKTPQTMWDEYEEAREEVRGIVTGRVRTTPALVKACKLCHWRSLCSAQLIEKEDLTLIPELGRARRDKLEEHVDSVTILAECDIDALVVGKKTVVPGLGAKTLERFHARARLQKTPGAQPYFRQEISLPSSEFELFFDVETDPMQDVCYLHGFLEREDGNVATERYSSFFAATQSEEKDAFRRAWSHINRSHPTALYFFSSYERTIFLRLAARYPEVATKDDVDSLFKSDIAFDLYGDLVRSAMEWPTYDLSIKTLASFFGFAWRDPEPSGAASVRWYYDWMTTREPQLRERILDYNEDDCRAMRVLVDGVRSLNREGKSDSPLLGARSRDAFPASPLADNGGVFCNEEVVTPEEVSEPSEDVVKEIERRVLDQGSLTKAEILDAWQLNDETYAQARVQLLKRNRLEMGPRKIGGFRAKKERGPLPDDKASSDLLLEQWETSVADRLAELFQHKELEELLGELRYTVRESRRLDTGADRRGTKAELAAALVVQYGEDLFANTKIREAVAKACKTQHPRKWHPGKAGAVEFVEKISFPSRLAGLPRDEAPPDYEYLEGRYTLPKLQDFQSEVHGHLTKVIHAGERAIVSLPTGAGKTRVAVEAIRDWLGDIYDPENALSLGDDVLWLAHTEELCEQAYACFKQVWEASTHVAPLFLARFWGRHLNDFRKHQATLKKVLDSPSVLISTPQRVVNLLESKDPDAKNIVNILRETLGLLLVDEAHRAGAPSYRRILEDLLPKDREVSVVGLTATPFRMEYLESNRATGTEQLKAVFGRLIEPTGTLGDNVRDTLVERSVLAEPRFVDIETHIKLRAPEIPPDHDFSFEEYEHIDNVLATHADSSARRLRVLEAIIDLARDPLNSILYFGPRVRDAECMAYLLRERRVPAGVVSGQTRDETRRALIDRFRRNEIRVLCNCEVLTTGFDAPKVTHIVMARPTVSQVLYEQIVGRGLRGPKFGGTKTCTILDCIDEFSGTVKPKLGYTRFRDVWRKRRRAS